MTLAYRNYIVLLAAMILMFSTAPFIILSASLVGKRMVLDQSLSTLPVALMIIGVVSATIPAGLMFEKIGYKLSFILAAAWAVSGSILAFFAIIHSIFALFCLGCFMMGNNLAFAQQARFTCLIGISEEKKNIAVSIYLSGGIISGLLGPQLSKMTKDFFTDIEFAGSFLFHALAMGIGMAILFFYKNIPVKAKTEKKNISLSFYSMMTSVNFYYPMLCAMIAYVTMSAIMTATPLSMMQYHDFDFNETTRVIQFHLLAMFFPSLFTGLIINRIGHIKVMLGGIILLTLANITAMIGKEYIHFVLSLIFLGVGWNFMFVSSTAILVKFNNPSKLLYLQSKNDFFVFFGQASGSLLSGTILHHLGWINLNLMTLPLAFLALLLTIVLANRFRVQKPI